MKVRILYQPNRTVRIIHPAPKSKKDSETEEQWLKRVFDQATQEGVEYDDVEASKIELPRSSRKFWRGQKGSPLWVDTVAEAEYLTKQAQEEKIQDEEEKIIREQAIQNLKESGGLPPDYIGEKI